jgi:hypothetical protein
MFFSIPRGRSPVRPLVLGYVGAVIIDAACCHIPVDRAAIGPDQTVTDPGWTTQIPRVWDAILSHLLAVISLDPLTLGVMPL